MDELASVGIETGTNGALTDEMKNMYLNFQVGNEVYGIEICHIVTIIAMQEITEMPDMPFGMKGFINLRGDMIPVVSMRLRFGKEESDINERTCIIVTRVGDREIGLIVDAIQETITINPGDISPPPGTGEGSDNPYVTGVARLSGEHTAILVSIQKLFAGSQF